MPKACLQRLTAPNFAQPCTLGPFRLDVRVVGALSTLLCVVFILSLSFCFSDRPWQVDR